MKRRIISIITALALCLSLCPTWALAAEADPSLCKHHPEHTEDCGYIAPTEGHDCGHEHTAACYTLGVLPDADSGDPYQVGGDTENLLDCHHSHDSACGYVQADPGAPCGYVCRICPIEDLIAALPEQVTEDNAAIVRGQLDEILDLFTALNEDEQGQLDLSRVAGLQEALDETNAPVQAAGEIDISQTLKNILTAEDSGCPGHTFTSTAATGVMIYVESGVHNVTFSGLNITASAMVGVAPGAAMNLTIEGTNTISAATHCAGIYVPVGATLVINGTGSLNVSGNGGGAGIGGATYAPDEDGSDGDPNCGTVVINGGTITAAGGGTNSASAGIGGGTTDDAPGNGGNVTINGGTVTAKGGSDNYYGGAGIGGAGGVSNKWNELVSGNGGTLTINGGTVNLTAGTHDLQYPAYGFGRGSCDPDTSTGTCELTLADASYLDSSTTLDPNGKYTINGDPTEDMIVVPELVYTGEVLDTSGIKIDDSKTGTGTYFGRTFTVKASADGWVLQDLGEVVEAGEYTAVFKKGDKEISKTFTVAKSGTDLTSEGKVKTYKDGAECSDFTASDTIKVVAMPTATGTAPQKAAARLRGGEPTAGQMAVYVGTTQVSVPADKGEGGSYTMTVSAADVLLAAGGPGTGITLTARFTANDNMADGAGTATVNITAAAVAERDGTLLGYYDESGLVAALLDKNNEGAVFTLLDNMETELKIRISCTLDLNGKTVHSKGEDDPTLSIYNGTTVTIRGEGTVLSEQGRGFYVGGTATLEGGTFISSGEGYSGVYVRGKLIVTGENVVMRNTGNGNGLSVDSGNEATAQLSAGTYEGGAAAIEIYQGTGTLAGLLNQEGASRVAYYKDNTTLVTEGLDGKTLPSGSYTVKACTHTGEGVCTYTHNENTSTHTKTCLACGKTWDAEDCDYGEYTHNDTGHTRICKLCEYQNVEAHNIKCTAEASGTVIAVSEACKTCGYGKDLGTVTIHIPKLVYGDLTGVVTAENTLTEPVAVAGNVKNPLGETIIFSDHATIGPPTMATLTGNALLSAGEHKIKINIVIIRDENALAECELTFNVTPAPLPEVTLSAESATYSGTEQKPALSVKQGETPLTEGTDYEVSYTRDGVVTNDFTSAGTVNITVTGKGNYTGSVEKTYTIGKATPTIAWNPTDVETIYTGQPADVKPVVTLVNGETYSGEIHYSWYGVADSLVPPTDARTYGNIKASIPEQDNYNTAITQIGLNLHIDYADQAAPAAPAATEENIKDTSITLTIIANAEYKRGDGEWQDSPVFTDLSPNTPYTFYARLKEDANHNASPDSAAASITTKKTMLGNGYVTAYGMYTYTGAEIVPPANDVRVVVNGKEVDSNQYDISASNNINAGVATATLTATAKADSNYSGSVSSEFTINRAALTVKANDQSITYGESIATSTDKVTPDGLVGDDRLESVTLEASTSDVPGGTIKPSGAIIQNGSGEDVTRNYDITYQPGALTIDKANVSLTTTPAANTLTYTGEAQALVSGGTASIGEVVYSLTETDGYSTTIPTGTNAGSYEVWYKVEGNENYNGIAATKIDVTISRKPVTTPTIKVTPDSYEYTGQQIKPGEDANTTVTVKDGDIVISASEYTLSYGENTHVGPGTVKVTDSGSGNYQITETTQNFTITKKLQNKLSITGKPETTAYGDTFTLTTSGGSGEGAVTWSVTGPAIVSATGEVKITGVDSVTVTANKAGGDDYENAEAILTFEATKKAVTAVVTADNKTYDGNTSATVTASVNNSDLVTDDSITITGVSGTFDNANAGTGKTVTVDGTGASISGNNADKYQVTFPASTTADIEKAIASVKTAPTAKTLTYTGEAQALVNAGTASVGEVVYSLTEAGTYSTAIPTGTNAGSYTVWYKIADTDNYTGTTPVKVDVTISKINYTGTIAASTSGKFGREKTYDLSDLLPEGYKLGTPTKTDANSIFEGTPTVSGTVLTYKLADNAGVGKIGTITIPVTESTNYNPFDLTITVTVTDKIVPTLTITPISVPYTGSAVPAGAIQGTAMADGKNIPGSWSFADGQALTNVADSGTKTVNFTPADEFKDDYAPATGTVRVTITKATPSLSLTPSPATLPNGGTVTLALSGLPSGGSATVTCSDANITVTKGSGNTWTANLPAGGASYTFTASYAGDGNHNGASANCTVSVEKITPTLSLTANPASLRGGGTVTLTLSGLPTGGTAAVTCSGGITVTAGAGSTWTATLPNSTATYTFTASYAGNASYHGASATCTVEASEVTVLPNPPEAEDGKQYQVIMEDGISEVPAGLQSIETLNTPEKLETAMKTAITQANSGVPQDNTAVYDVELQISDNGGATWTKATAANFPANGLTVTLPYPAGTNSSYTFTVVHMFTTSDFNKTPGDTETPRVTNTASGLQFTVTGLSPISVGWVQPSTPTTPTGPTGGGGGGGGWSSSTYAVTVERAEHGKVTSNRTNASSGSTVTLTVTPDTGYVLDTLTVTDSRGSEIKLTAQGGGKYTFTMPGRAVTVKAAFAPLPDDTEKPCDGGVDCPSHGFTDLGTVGTWYHEAVDYVLRNNLMGGYGNGLFGPNDTLTRAQFAQILYNKEGRPAVTGGGIFTDVAPVAWCAPAITWAAERGIVGGYGNGAFGPNDNITREQLAVMLWRYAGSPAATDKELHFNDADKASGYALEALRWAVENGVMSGKGGGILDPKGLATRAQTAQMLKNFLKDD